MSTLTIPQWYFSNLKKLKTSKIGKIFFKFDFYVSYNLN